MKTLVLGLLSSACVLVALAWAAPAAAFTHVVKPGETTLFHRHSLDNVAVQLSGATIQRQFPGQDWVTSPAKEGSVGFTAGTKIPYVHRLTNIGSTVFHVMDIEILP